MIAPDFTLRVISLDGKESQGEGFRCCHCGTFHVTAAALQSILLSKPDRVGWCDKCQRPTCAKCKEHVTEEQQASNAEAGRPLLTPAAMRVAFPRNPLILLEKFPGK